LYVPWWITFFAGFSQNVSSVSKGKWREEEQWKRSSGKGAVRRAAMVNLGEQTRAAHIEEHRECGVRRRDDCVPMLK
jgi:hypothetical protein